MKDRAFMDGYAAYPCPAPDNPFREGSDEFGSWVDGWLTGKANCASVQRWLDEIPGPPPNACQHKQRISETTGMGHTTYEVCADCGHRFV
jgi:hypothetical protein